MEGEDQRETILRYLINLPYNYIVYIEQVYLLRAVFNVRLHHNTEHIETYYCLPFSLTLSMLPCTLGPS